ncbi:FHA domain-containing protein [Platanthera zijinensis]|uniref:FHA domain-containing protein n=1 Tax=Platanthera zijinensis TaxID=2320716 RepID=A0AAP0BXC3_9ASPA
MTSSSLSLNIDNGPRKGETLDCKPGIIIRIGRVITGNTFAIKSPSISQKHLTVQFLPESALWAVTDLGSSNGTYLNSYLISPDVPTPLADGDVIRIGDRTRISVHISASQPEAPPLRRSARQKLPVEEKVNKPEEIKRNGRPRRRIMAVKENKSGIATRASSRAVNTMVSELNLEEENIDSANSHSESEKGATNSNVRIEEEDPNASREKEEDDERIKEEMDNMTMAEWFDKMEEFLPMEINRVAEEIIESLRAKARRFDDYVDHSSNPTDK